MTQELFSPETGAFPLTDPTHRDWLRQDSLRQLAFFNAAKRDAGGFHQLDLTGAPLPGSLQELHSTTRLIHSYALAHLAGLPGAEAMIAQGIEGLARYHHDPDHGGYLWAADDTGPRDTRKLAYGHVFVLLAGSSAHMAGHPDAPALIDDATDLLDRHYWEEAPGLLADEWNRDWTPFSTYRGMNANMHGVEALLAAYEATGREVYLTRSGRILDFFLRRTAPVEGWRVPEHYDQNWQIDRAYDGNPMFRPAGTTPGHSFELGRLMLQHWDLDGRRAADAPGIARALIYQALRDGWDTEAGGGIVYTLGFDGKPAIRDRYWWPVTEAIGALAALLKHAPEAEDAVWYRRLWDFADRHFVDHRHGGWFHEIDAKGAPTATQFHGKPDLYHSLQATLFPLCPGLSGFGPALKGALD